MSDELPPDVGVSEAPDVGQSPEGFQQSVDKVYRLVFRENRKFELTIAGGGVMFFDPYGKHENVPAWVVDKLTEYEKAFFIVEVM